MYAPYCAAWTRAGSSSSRRTTQKRIERSWSDEQPRHTFPKVSFFGAPANKQKRGSRGLCTTAQPRHTFPRFFFKKNNCAQCRTLTCKFIIFYFIRPPTISCPNKRSRRTPRGCRHSVSFASIVGLFCLHSTTLLPP